MEKKSMDINIRKCSMNDLIELREIAYRTFSDAFSHLNTPVNMKTYLEKAFNLKKLQEELSNSHSLFYFLYADRKLAGYLKLNEYQTQTDIYDPRSLEIERIYVSKIYQENGLGQLLINKAIDTACIRNKSYLWLGVWERNHKALQF